MSQLNLFYTLTSWFFKICCNVAVPFAAEWSLCSIFWIKILVSFDIDRLHALYSVCLIVPNKSYLLKQEVSFQTIPIT
jgi:hypothetical protein